MLNGTNQKILCVGRIYCDLIFTGIPNMPVLGQETFAGGVKMHAGGGCYITAAYLSALGNSVAITAMLPAEPFRAIVTDEIRHMGLDDRFCEQAPVGSDPQITVAMVRKDERAFLTRRASTALPHEMAGSFALPDLTHLHIGELTTLIEHPELIEKARAANLTISLDCGWDEAAFCHPGLSDLIAEVDVFLPNSAEAARLSENDVPLTSADHTIIKRGSKGAELHTGGQTYIGSTQQVHVIDTTGAGDAFNAGFLTAWLQNQDPESCLAAGNHAGSIAVGRVGGAAGLSPKMFLSTKATVETRTQAAL